MEDETNPRDGCEKDGPLVLRALRDGCEKDGPLVLRALIHHRWMSPAGRWTQFISLYPAGQYRSTEDLHAFDLALKERLRTLDWYKVTVVRGECVTVRSMSRALYSMDGLQGMCTARSWLGLGLAVLRMRCRAGIEKTIAAIRPAKDLPSLQGNPRTVKDKVVYP